MAEEHGHHQEMALRLSAALWRFWVMRGHMQRGTDFPGAGACEKRGNRRARERRRYLFAARRTRWCARRTGTRQRSLAEESLALCQELGDTQGIAHLLSTGLELSMGSIKLACGARTDRGEP